MTDYCIENDGARRAELAAIYRHKQEQQYTDLLRAADALARAVEDDLSVWPESMTEGSELKSALTAYKQAKENTND